MILTTLYLARAKNTHMSVQAKPDYPVLETGLSSFHVFNNPNRTYPFTHFSFSSSQEQL
jgi:hypothetical protein